MVRCPPRTGCPRRAGEAGLEAEEGGPWFCGTMMLGLLLATSSLMLPRTAAAQVVRGIVVDAHGDSPIMVVNVSILDEGGEVLRTTTTDRNGNFMIGTRQPGEYRLRAERLGYESEATKR